MVTAPFFLDSHLAEWTWLSRSSNLVHVFLLGLVLVAHLVVFMACHTFVPFALVVEADLCFALGAHHVWSLGQWMNLTMITTFCRAP